MQAELSPLSADYTGQRINDLRNAVYLRLMTPLGSWWAEPSLGSRLHELAREKDMARIRVLAERYAGDALQALLDDGRAARVDVRAQQPHDGWCRLLVEVTDQTGRAQTFSHQVRVS